MNRLIDDLLNLSRVELSEHLQPSDRVVLADLIDQIAAELQPLFETRRARLAADLESDLPDVLGDEDQLAQVLQNLMENATKYGREEGHIQVVARRANRSGQDGVSISVRDDGPGIPALHLPRLTERFYRVSTHQSRSVGGTGLGLAIVKHIVNRHRGQLRIESVEGDGTTVFVWLPAASARR